MSILLEQTRDWLNQYVAPHQLVSITIHEDQHENETNFIRAIIAHTAGEKPVPLKNSSAAKDLPSRGQIYTLYTNSGDANKTWDEVTSEALVLINNKGG